MDIEPDITRIVGKNESGKSALLEAVAKTGYFDEKDTSFQFDKDLDYPRSQLVRAKKENPETIRCEYTLSANEIEEIEEYFATGVLKRRSFGLITKYDGSRTVDEFKTDFDVFKNWLIETYGDVDIKAALEDCDDFASVYRVAGENKDDTDWTRLNSELEKIKAATKWTGSLYLLWV